MRRCLRGRAGTAGTLAWPLIPYMRANLARKREGLSAADAVIAVSSVIARRSEGARAGAGGHRRPADSQSGRRRRHPARRRRDAAADGRALRALRRQARAEQGRGPPGRRRGGGVACAASRCGRRWPAAGRLERQAAGQRGVDLRVQGWLPRDQVLGWMRHARLLVFPSHGPESLSRVLLEAAALGVPIAAMDTGGTRDIVIHEQTGLLSDSAPGLARDVARLCVATASWPLASARAPGCTSNAPSMRRPCLRASSRCTRDVVAVVEARVADHRAVARRGARPVVLWAARVRRARAPPLRPGAPSPGRRLARHRDHAHARRHRPAWIRRDGARWRSTRRATSGSWTTARSRWRAAPARRFSIAARPTRGSADAPADWQRIWSPRARRTSSTASAPACGVTRRPGVAAPARRWS